MENNRNGIGKKLEQLRKNAGETQDDIAFALGVSRQTLYRWESNIRTPNAKQLKMLCEHFNVPADYFFVGVADLETAVTEQVQEEIPETEAVAASAEKNNKKYVKLGKLFNFGIIICSLLFAFSSVLFTVICFFTFENEGGIESTLMIEGVWVLYVLAALAVVSLAGIIAVLILKKRKCNRLGTKMLQTNEGNSDTMK